MATTKKYELVLEAMRGDLESWPEGRPFLTDQEATERYGASRITIRRAYAVLQAEGRIQRIKRFGTKVCPRPGRQLRLVAFMGIEFAQHGVETVILRGLEHTLRQAGASLLVANADNNLSLALQNVDRLAELGVDGLIYVPMFISPEENRRLVDYIQEKGIPLVVALRMIAGLEDKLHYVTPDNFGGAFEMTRHLLSLGHRRVAFFHQHMSAYTTPRDSRLDGYRAALSQAGVEPATDLDIDMPVGSLPLMLQQWRQAADPPTAIFFNDDLGLFAFLDLARGAGLRVPEDISAAGFDALTRMGVNQTTIVVPYFELGQTAATTLSRLVQQPTLAPTHTIMPVSLRIGETTGINPRLAAQEA